MRLFRLNSCFIMRGFFLLIILLAFITAQDDRLRLKQADVLENITVNGQSMQDLKGKVTFIKGEMVMNCDWARFNQRTDQGFLLVMYPWSKMCRASPAILSLWILPRIS